MPLSALIAQGYPEEVALVTLAFVISRSPIKWKIICLSSVVLAFANYILRNYFDPFGIHTIFTIVMIFLILLFFGKCSIVQSIFASLLSMALLIICEVTCVSTLVSIFNISTKELTSDTKVRILVTLPQVIIMFIIGFIIVKYFNKKRYVYADKS